MTKHYRLRKCEDCPTVFEPRGPCETRCRPCYDTHRRSANAIAQERWRKQNPHAVKNATLKYRFGIDLTHLNRRLDEQEGKCAICGLPFEDNGGRQMVVDHDHKTGRVRSLLCQNCNKAIGLLGDDAVVVERAAKYLKTHVSEVALAG